MKQHSVMFDLCAPMKGCVTAQERHLFMEGDLKFKDNISKVSGEFDSYPLLGNFLTLRFKSAN